MHQSMYKLANPGQWAWISQEFGMELLPPISRALGNCKIWKELNSFDKMPQKSLGG